MSKKGEKYIMNLNTIINSDCMIEMHSMDSCSVNLTLTDIPYGVVSREEHTPGFKTLDKGNADIETFNLSEFLPDIYRVTKDTIIIFCAKEQLSQIYEFFNEKQKNKKGTVRQLIWKKTNPSPMNGQHVYLSGIENAVWFKKHGGTFNAHCKNTVFEYPCGRSKLHPTEKNHKLIKELILDNSNEGDIVFDPCSGSGRHCKVAKDCNRNFYGIELDEEYFEISQKVINE